MTMKHGAIAWNAREVVLQCDQTTSAYYEEVTTDI